MKVEMENERNHVFAPGMNTSLYLRLKGKPEFIQIREAIYKAVYANEILCSKIEQSDNGKCYFVPLRRPVIKIARLENDRAGRWIEIVLNQQRVCFDLAKGELIRFYVLLNSKSTDLLIVAHHLAGDGTSLIKLVKDIMTVLGGINNLPIRPIQVYSSKDAPEESKKRLKVHKTADNLNKNWYKQRKIFTREEYVHMFKNYWRNRRTKILSETLSEEEIEKLKESAAREGVSVNSAITTSFFRVLQKKEKMSLTVDMRPERCTGMGNYTTSITITYKYNFRKSFWENAKNVHQLIYREINDPIRKYFLYHFICKFDPTLMDAAYFSAFDHFDNKPAEKVKNLLGISNEPQGMNLSNLRELDIPMEYGEYGIEEVTFVPPLVPNVKAITGVVTANHKMCLTMQSLEDDKAEEMFHKAVKILYKYCSSK